MVLTLAILAGLALTAHGQPAGEKPDKECCDTKTVGGVTYSLIGQMDTKMYNCLSDCIYMREGQEGSKFCFAMGDLQVECNDEEMAGSGKPPMEGSEKPPMEGSEKPPMEGSEKPPMEGVMPSTICPNGTVSCGDECLEPSRAMKFKECDGKCIEYMTPCNAKCGDRMLYCPPNNETRQGTNVIGWLSDSCVWDDGNTYFCGDYCREKNKACDGVCSDDRVPCDRDDGQVQCLKNDSPNEIYKNCDGKCILKEDPCNDECLEGWTEGCYGFCEEIGWAQCDNACPEGWETCGDFQCIRNNSQDENYWSCGTRCYHKRKPCNGECADGWLPFGNWTSGSRPTCYKPSSSVQSCQGSLYGEPCDGECPEGFELCTIGYTNENNKQVCYNSDSGPYYKYKGFCWRKTSITKNTRNKRYNKMLMSNLEIDDL